MRGGVVGDQGDGGLMRRMPDRGGARWSLFVTLRMGEREYFVAGGSDCCWSVGGGGVNLSVGVVDTDNVVVGVVEGVVNSDFEVVWVIADAGVTGDDIGVLGVGVGDVEYIMVMVLVLMCNVHIIL